MEATIYSVLKDIFLPSLCVWVYKGDDLIIRKSLERTLPDIKKSLIKKDDAILSLSRTFIVVKKSDNPKKEKAEDNLFADLPNKSMANKRRKVRTK